MLGSTCRVGKWTEAQPRVASAVDGDSKGLGGDVKDIDYGTSEVFNWQPPTYIVW